MTSQPILEVTDLTKHFPVSGSALFKNKSVLKAVDGVSLKVYPGETLGIVGESGCGKSTLAKTIARLYEPSSGKIVFKGQDIGALNSKALRAIRPKIQYVFQDPYESLNPRHTVSAILEEPFVIHTQLSANERAEKVCELLTKVGLPTNCLNKYPHEFSGGQRQRIGIARAIALNPDLVICDEPVSALDVSVQSQIVNLLLALQKEMGLALLFIAHDLSVVKHISDRVSVMYLGKIVETSEGQALYKQPHHPYSQFLIDAIPKPDPRQSKKRMRLTGELPSPIAPPAGCHFHTRCPLAQKKCKEEQPKLVNQSSNDHLAACHFIEESLNQWDKIWASSKENAR